MIAANRRIFEAKQKQSRHRIRSVGSLEIYPRLVFLTTQPAECSDWPFVQAHLDNQPIVRLMHGKKQEMTIGG